MKKILSFVISLLFVAFGVVPIFSATAGVSIQQGEEKLKEQFIHSKASLDYVYYSPVKNENDSVKYPLVVWLHGNSSGDYAGHQLDNCNIANWSSQEYQSRFEGTEGAFLLLPRCPTNSIVLAWGDERMLDLKSTIDTFILENADHIDTNRIYIGGYSMGGKMVIRMASTYPDFFAAAFPLSPVYAPTNLELSAMKDMPVWLCVCKNDEYISLNQATVKSNWNYLMSVSTCPEECRMSTFDKIYRPDGSLREDEVHNTWDPVCYDLFMNNGEQYLDMVTVDGNGNIIELEYPDGMIKWLSRQSLDNRNYEEQEQNMFQKILAVILNFIKKLMSIFSAN